MQYVSASKLFAPVCPLVHHYDPFVGSEVRAVSIVFSGHPHTLTLAGLRLRSHQVGKDDVTVEVVLVHILGRRIEVGSTCKNTLPLLLLTLLPNIHLLLEHLVIEGDDCELCELG